MSCGCYNEGVFKSRAGIEFGQRHFVTDILHADDIAVFATMNSKNLNIPHDISDTARPPFGLVISAEKSEILTVDGTFVNVHVNGVDMDQAQQFNRLTLLCGREKEQLHRQ